MKEQPKLQNLVHLREQGEHARCIQSIAELLEKSPQVAPGLRRSLVALRSDCYLDTERWKEAIEDLTMLLKGKPEPALFANRGLAFWYVDDLDSAFRDFQRAIRADPSDAVTLRNMGRLQIQRGKTRSGLLYLRRAVAVSPNNVISRVLLGDALAKTSNWVEACHEYVAALKVDPSNKRALQQIGKIERYLENG